LKGTFVLFYCFSAECYDTNVRTAKVLSGIGSIFQQFSPPPSLSLSLSLFALLVIYWLQELTNKTAVVAFTVVSSQNGA